MTDSLPPAAPRECHQLVGVRGFDGQCTRRTGHRGAHYDGRYDVLDGEDAPPAAPAPLDPPDTLETMRDEFEATDWLDEDHDYEDLGEFVERMFTAWRLERDAKVQLRKELAAELARGEAGSSGPPRALLQEWLDCAPYQPHTGFGGWYKDFRARVEAALGAVQAGEEKPR